MPTRDAIADELLRGCPTESRADHETIAAAIRRGDNLLAILAMPEVDRWPETHVWLRTQFQDN